MLQVAIYRSNLHLIDALLSGLLPGQHRLFYDGSVGSLGDIIIQVLSKATRLY